MPQARPDVLFGLDHRHVGGLHRRNQALTVVVDHPERQCHCAGAHLLDDGFADPVVRCGLVDESLTGLVDEDPAGEPQRERGAPIGMGRTQGPPRLIHQVGRGADGHACLQGQSRVAWRAHRVPGIAGHAEALAQGGVVLETPRGEQYTGAGADCDASAVLLDDGADDALVGGDQLDQRAVRVCSEVCGICGDRRQQPADQRPPADEVLGHFGAESFGVQRPAHLVAPARRGVARQAVSSRCGADRPGARAAMRRSSPAMAAHRIRSDRLVLGRRSARLPPYT